MKRPRRRPARIAALSALALSLACGRPAARPERTLRVALDADIFGLDPTQPETNTQSALSNVFESLVDFDREMKLIPGLASRWSTPDDRTWVFVLREGVRFHDGSPLTAAAAAAAISLVKNAPGSGLTGMLSSVADAVPLDATRIRVTTRTPQPLLLHDLAHVPIVKGTSLETVRVEPIGTGPYRVVRWVRGRELELERFDAYWGRKPPIARATFVVRESGEASMGALERREVDVARVPSTLASRVSPAYTVRVSSGLATWFLWINSLPGSGGRPNPLADPRLRTAIDLAIDRRATARLATGRESSVADQLVPKTIFGYARELKPPPFDPSEARRRRAQAGPAGDVPLVLWHRAGEGYTDVAALVAANLRDVGFRVETRAVPWAELVDGFTKRRYGLSIVEWVFDSGDAGSFLRDTIHSRKLDERTGMLNPGFEDPEMDRLLDEALSIFDGPTRLARFEELMSLAQRAVPAVPLYHQPNVWGAAKDLTWEPRVDGHLRIAEMSFDRSR